jgi:hypothetical protein
MTTSKIMICHIILCTTLVLHASLCSLVIAIDDKERSNGFQPRFRRNYMSLTAYKNIDKRIHYHDTRNLQPPKPKSKQQMRQKMKKNPHNTSSSINVSSTRTNDEKAGGGSKASTALTGTTHVYNTDTSMAQSSSTNVNSSSQESLRNATPIEKNLSVYMYALAASLVGIAIASVMIQQRRVRNDTSVITTLTFIVLSAMDQKMMLSNIIPCSFIAIFFYFSNTYYSTYHEEASK